MTLRFRPITLVVALAAVASGCGGGSTHKPAPARTRAPARRSPARTARSRRASEDVALRRLARRGRPVFCGGRERPMVALTFDDGPGPYTRLALKILHKARVDATFFLVGRNIGRFPGVAQAEARVNVLGDHTWTHPYLPSLSAGAIASEMGSTQRAAARAAHRRVALFRPPFGAHNAEVDATARRLGMVEILWNVDSGDSEGANWQQIARNVAAGIRPGSIILMHENRGQTIRALKFVILPHLLRRHVQLVTVPELLTEDPPSRAQLRKGARGCPTIRSHGSGG